MGKAKRKVKEIEVISKPEIGEYKGCPTISIPLLDGNNTEGQPFSFGLRKAKAVVAYIKDIKKFYEEGMRGK